MKVSASKSRFDAFREPIKIQRNFIAERTDEATDIPMYMAR